MKTTNCLNKKEDRRHKMLIISAPEIAHVVEKVHHVLKRIELKSILLYDSYCLSLTSRRAEIKLLSIV